MRLDHKSIDTLIKRALAEDLGRGDITTEATVAAGSKSRAKIVAKESGIIAGLPIAARVFKHLDKRIRFQALVKEGAAVKKGAAVAALSGPTAPILIGERTALNILCRLSGIAGLTRQYVKAAAGTKAKILDTRKTTPTLRALEKYAVSLGGGQNYRWGLYDVVLIKDNHLAAAGGVKAALERVRARWGGKYFTVVEVKNLKEVKAALATEVDRLMLDNMSIPQMKKAVALIAGQKQIEASGNMTLKRAKDTARLGVDYISVGALTTKPALLDLSLQFMKG